MGCNAGMWRSKHVHTIGGHCCQRTRPYRFMAGEVYGPGTLFTVAEEQDPMSQFITVRPMTAPTDECVGVLHCELDASEWTEDCTGPLCIHGEYNVEQIPWPEGWGVEEVRTVMHNCRCCGLYFNWGQWC